MPNLKKIKLYKFHLLRYLIVAFVLLIAGSFSFVLSKNVTPEKTEIVKSKVIVKTEIEPTEKVEEQEAENIPSAKSSYIGNEITQPTPSVPQNINNVTTITTQSTGGNSVAPVSQIANNILENKVSLSVNGGAVLDIKIPENANHCDVLSRALEQGKLQSLNMRFDNSLGSNAVYQINGVGRDNSVWWTYTVNGQSPNQGCSFIKANNGDKVEWKYIGA